MLKHTSAIAAILAVSACNFIPTQQAAPYTPPGGITTQQAVQQPVIYTTPTVTTSQPVVTQTEQVIYSTPTITTQPTTITQAPVYTQPVTTPVYSEPTTNTVYSQPVTSTISQPTYSTTTSSVGTGTVVYESPITVQQPMVTTQPTYNTQQVVTTQPITTTTQVVTTQQPTIEMPAPGQYSSPAVSNAALGGVGGAVAGGFIGNEFGSGDGNKLAIAAGTLLGAYLGYQVGGSFDNNDWTHYDAVSQHALERAPTGTESAWSNPQTGMNGVFTPTRTFQNDDGQYCREYKQTVIQDGQVHEGAGSACRSSAGKWVVQG